MVIFSIIKSVFYLITFKLQFPKTYQNKIVRMNDGIEFKIFRHMHLKSTYLSEVGSILIVRFKFKKFSHKTNIKMSRIPILLIAGSHGFRDKVWMIDWRTGFWQGVYLWKDGEAIENYKKSFVLGIMNKRSIDDTIQYNIVPNKNIDDYLQSKML